MSLETKAENIIIAAEVLRGEGELVDKKTSQKSDDHGSPWVLLTNT